MIMSDRIDRPEYIKRLIEYKGKDLIKIVTGIRRCGKSTLLDLFEDYLLKSGVSPENIIHMNMESLQYRNTATCLTMCHFMTMSAGKL